MSNTKSCRQWFTLGGMVLVVAALAAFSPDAQAANAPLRSGSVAHVTVQSGLLSVDAREARLIEVLEAIGRQAGAKVVLRGDLGIPVTLSFTDLPLNEGIQRLVERLVSGYSVVLIYSASSQVADSSVLTEMWVIASGTGHRYVGSFQNQQAEPPDSGAAGNEPDLMSALKDEKPEVRLQTLQAVVRTQGVQAVQALREVAIQDAAPHVRRAAIRLLASMNTDEARDALGATLSDRDPLVQAAATRAFARWRELDR